MEHEIGAPGLDRGLRHQRRKIAHGGIGVHVDFGSSAGARRIEQYGPVDPRGIGLEFGDGHRVVHLDLVAALLCRPAPARDLLFEFEHHVRTLARIGEACLPEQGLRIIEERGASGIELLAFAKVVDRVGHGQSALDGHQHRLFGIAGVRHDAEIDRASGFGEPHLHHEIGAVVDHHETIDQVAQRLNPDPVASFDIHVAAIEVGKLLLARSRLLGRSQQVGNHRVDLLIRLAANLGEGSPVRITIGYGGTREPFTGHVAIEIVARIDAAIHGSQIYAPFAVAVAIHALLCGGEAADRQGCN